MTVIRRSDVCDIRKEREIISGKYAMASSDGGASIVALHSPIEYVIATFLISSGADWPYIPAPESLADEGYVLMHSKVVTHVPAPNIGEHTFTVSGFYLYVKGGLAASPNDDMKTGVVPGDIGLSQESAILKKAYFQLGLLQSNYFNNNPSYPP